MKYNENTVKRALTMVEDQMREPGDSLASSDAARTAAKLAIGLDERENFGVFFLDTRHCLIKFEVLFRGTVDASIVYPREVVKQALLCNASAVILTHNHPSGNPDPSSADIAITSKLKEILAVIDVRLLDHIIVAGTKSVSLASRQLV